MKEQPVLGASIEGATTKLKAGLPQCVPGKALLSKGIHVALLGSYSMMTAGQKKKYFHAPVSPSEIIWDRWVPEVKFVLLIAIHE
jgi:hypothetical protein